MKPVQTRMKTLEPDMRWCEKVYQITENLRTSAERVGEALGDSFRALFQKYITNFDHLLNQFPIHENDTNLE